MALKEDGTELFRRSQRQQIDNVYEENRESKEEI